MGAIVDLALEEDIPSLFTQNGQASFAIDKFTFWVFYEGAAYQVGYGTVRPYANSVTSNNFARFRGTDGTVIEDAGVNESSFESSGSVATAIAAHEAASDPHPGYLTPAEGDAAYQPLDSDLTAIAALSTTSFGRGFNALVDASAARTYVGAGTAAVQNTGTSGANVPLMSTANAWSDTQTISIETAGDVNYLVCADSSWTSGDRKSIGWYSGATKIASVSAYYTGSRVDVRFGVYSGSFVPDVLTISSVGIRVNTTTHYISSGDALVVIGPSELITSNATQGAAYLWSTPDSGDNLYSVSWLGASIGAIACEIYDRTNTAYTFVGLSALQWNIGSGTALGTNYVRLTTSGLHVRRGEATAGTYFVKIGGSVAHSNVSTGNTAATLTTLMSHTIRANALGTNGDSVHGRFRIKFANTVNVDKQVTLEYDGNTIFDTGSLAITAETWAWGEFWIQRTGASSQECLVRLEIDAYATPIVKKYTGAISNTADKTLTIRGNGTSANDVTCDSFKSWWSPAGPGA